VGSNKEEISMTNSKSDIEELKNLQREAAELVALKDDVRGFIRNPIDALVPGAITQLLSGAAKGFKSRKES
jgi:hypothetical protein